ncbi:MAG: Bsp6I family type II restriction endonuclease [Lachnospiraceae bacterium]|nr:Bsp6I family type II restriction endonuclease [Lachnospiraceae bacterium]
MSNSEKVVKMELVKVDSQRIKTVIDTYYHWKQLDAEIKTLSGTRGINFPSELSEYMACYALDLMVNKEGSNGDAVDMSDPENPMIIEIKGSSADETSAPNSFSPSEHFDDLVFVRLEKYDDLLKIYRLGINSEDLKKIKVSKTQTVEDQQRQGRRPRFSIQDKIVKEQGLEPDAIFYIREKRIEKK